MNRWSSRVGADALVMLRIVRDEGFEAAFQRGLVTLRRRRGDNHGAEFMVPPDSPVAWRATLQAISRRYALRSHGPLAWPEADAVLDAQRIAALRPDVIDGQANNAVTVTRAIEIRDVFATLEALRSWPDSRPLSVLVEICSGTNQPWWVLELIPGVTMTAGSGSPMPVATPQNLGDTNTLCLIAGSLPLPGWAAESLAMLSNADTRQCLSTIVRLEDFTLDNAGLEIGGWTGDSEGLVNTSTSRIALISWSARVAVPGRLIPTLTKPTGHSSTSMLRILVLTTAVPNLAGGSGSHDVYWFARHAHDLGNHVLLVAMSPRPHDRGYRWELRRAGINVVDGAVSAEQLRRSLPRTILNSDVIVAFDKSLATNAAKLSARSARPPVLFLPLDLKQFPLATAMRMGLEDDAREFGFRVMTEGHVEAVRAAELRAVEACDLTGVISSVELDALAAMGVTDKVVVFPMLRADPVRTSSQKVASDPHVVFVAGFAHPPNYYALKWFLDDIWPLVRRQLPWVLVEVYGSGLSPKWRAEWEARPGVSIRGPYRRESDPYQGDAVAVAPLVYGGGVKGKVVTAVGHGAVVVGTSFATQGLPPDVVDAIVQAEGTQDFADALVRVLTDSALRAELRAAGLAAYVAAFSQDQGRREVAGILRTLVGSGGVREGHVFVG